VQVSLINTNNLFRKFLNYAEKSKKTRKKKYTGVNRKNDPLTGTKYEGLTLYTLLEKKMSRKELHWYSQMEGMRCNGSKSFKELHVQNKISKTRHFTQSNTSRLTCFTNDQNKRDEMEKHMHISHANTGIKQQHFTQTARHVTAKYEVIKFNL
jgi:hypothetical protein